MSQDPNQNPYSEYGGTRASAIRTVRNLAFSQSHLQPTDRRPRLVSRLLHSVLCDPFARNAMRPL